MYRRAYVEITNICNMNCSFCHGHSRPRKQMSREEFSHILSQLKGHTEYIYYHLMGEPLTHLLLPEFISMAKEKGFHSIITTNGTLLKKRGLELLEAGAEKVSVSEVSTGLLSRLRAKPSRLAMDRVKKIPN